MLRQFIDRPISKVDRYSDTQRGQIFEIYFCRGEYLFLLLGIFKKTIWYIDSYFFLLLFHITYIKQIINLYKDISLGGGVPLMSV